MYIKTDTGKIAANVSHVFCTPTVPAGGTTYRLVLRQHGAGSSYRESLVLGARYGLMTKGLTDAGLAVLYVDASDLPSGGWGNDAAITRLGDAWTWAKANLPVKTDKVLLLGQSAGNVWGMNWARQNVSQVGAIASIIGVLDIQDIRDNNRQSLAAGIDLAYSGVSGTPPTGGQYATHNPVQYAADLATIPQKHYYSTDDTIALPSRLDAYLSAAGLDASSKVSFGTVGHSIGSGLGTPSLWTDPGTFLAQYI
jgi:hypothetical protein